MAAAADQKPEDTERLTQEWDSRLDSPPSRSTTIAAAVVAGLLVLVFVVCFGFFIINRPAQHHGIILFIGDGFGPASATLARTMLNRSLSLDPYLVGTVKTFSASSLITDSAAAATAYACGEKTNNLWVSVLPDGTPCTTLLEAAQAAGWRVGLIATTDLTDATPAAFSAHVNGRDDMAGIAAQQIAHKIDVMIGGGSAWFTPLASQAAEEGITLTYNWADVRDRTVATPFIAALTPSRMPYMIDRPADTTLPTLKDCFEAAIDYLTRDSDKPFFLMVEGSRIDHAGHGNDPAAQWQEVAAFESAFGAAAKYATSHGGVALISTADHETGGLTIGRDPGEFSKAAEYAWHPEVLRAVNASAERIAAAIPGANAADIVSAVYQYTGIYVDEEEAAYIIRGAAAGVKANAIGRVISRRAGLAWTTMGHTGIDVNLYAAGAAPRFHGNYDNTQVGRAIAALNKFQIGRVTK